MAGYTKKKDKDHGGLYRLDKPGKPKPKPKPKPVKKGR